MIKHILLAGSLVAVLTACNLNQHEYSEYTNSNTEMCYRTDKLHWKTSYRSYEKVYSSENVLNEYKCWGNIILTVQYNKKGKLKRIISHDITPMCLTGFAAYKLKVVGDKKNTHHAYMCKRKTK